MLITRCNCRGLFSHTRSTKTKTQKKSARVGGNGQQVATIKYASEIRRQGEKLKSKHTSTRIRIRTQALIYAVLVRRTSNCNLGQAYCLQIINIHMHLNKFVCVLERERASATSALKRRSCGSLF